MNKLELVVLLQIVLCVFMRSVCFAEEFDEYSYEYEQCCAHGEGIARKISKQECAKPGRPEDLDLEKDAVEPCKKVASKCCEEFHKQKEECTAGMTLAESKQCNKPSSDIGKNCCEECSFGILTGESQGKIACGELPGEDVIASTGLRKTAFRKCCLEAAEKPETTTMKITTTTKKKIVPPKPKACQKNNGCEQLCVVENGKDKCQCTPGYNLSSDGKSCKDVNECAGLREDLCSEEGTVCHNTPGSFKCVPIRKRDVSLSCPPGFKRNLANQVCDDINECQLTQPPCPKYLCENTIGGYKCGGKPGKPAIEATSGPVPTTTSAAPTEPKEEICPSGFRSGPDDECVDIDECEERLDDCQRLSQYCINSHGNYFCQDHVSKRCAPGFKVNKATGVCEDIDECEEDSETCKRGEICVNLPGAYNCKSKISTLPKLAPKTQDSNQKCQEGTRLRPGGKICEDIDECRENIHLCDQFQNCINTYGGHECRCKNGFEVDHSSGSCVDINECALKLDNCAAGQQCLNLLGTFTCKRQTPGASTTTTTNPAYEYEYYDSEESTSENSPTVKPPQPPTIRTTSTSTTTLKPNTRVVPTRPTYSRPSSPRPSYPRPERTTTTERPTTTERVTTTEKLTTTERLTTTEIPTTTAAPTTTPRQDRPAYPYTNRPPAQPRPLYTTTELYSTTPQEIDITPPDNTITVEKEKDDNGTIEINTSDIPKNTWTNIVGKEADPEFDPKKLYCLNGFERNENGECMDINECNGDHGCTSTEMCINRQGGYTCECVDGHRRDSTGWCVPIPTTSTTTEYPETTTERRSSVDWPHTPRRPNYKPYSPPEFCELGYEYNAKLGRCVDIDECEEGQASCAPHETCENNEGGYRCVCGRNCGRNDEYSPNHLPPSPTIGLDSNVITVGSQYGKRGPRTVRPIHNRMSSGVRSSCPWGYSYTSEKRCTDVDECESGTSECGAHQRCENFFGGYSCKCPAGHRMIGKQRCEDIDECSMNRPCSSYSTCVNTVGSYNCQCRDGFTHSHSNDKVCVDVNECLDNAQICEQECNNVWGGYRCSCHQGYRLHTDNRTCVDINECSEWSATGRPGRLCSGQCVNEPGSYRCDCPKGYKTSSDGRSCTDINECETGEAPCASSSAPGDVCQNTRGSYHCHRIECPHGYRLEKNHRCIRIQRSCQINDWGCLRQPGTYNYNFITLVSKMYIPSGSVDLFTMHGPSWSHSVISFELNIIEVQANTDVRPADRTCFDTRQNGNVCVISLLCSLSGPQVVEMELTMSLYQRAQFAGTAVARLIVIVSEYEF